MEISKEQMGTEGKQTLSLVAALGIRINAIAVDNRIGEIAKTMDRLIDTAPYNLLNLQSCQKYWTDKTKCDPSQLSAGSSKQVMPHYYHYTKLARIKSQLLAVLEAIKKSNPAFPKYRISKHFALYTSAPNVQALPLTELVRILTHSDDVITYDYHSMFPAIAADLYNIKNLIGLYEKDSQYIYPEIKRSDAKLIFLALMFGSSITTLIFKHRMPREAVYAVQKTMRRLFPELLKLTPAQRDRIRCTASFRFNQHLRDLLKFGLDLIVPRHDQFIYYSCPCKNPNANNPNWPVEMPIYLPHVTIRGEFKTAPEITEEQTDEVSKSLRLC